MAVEHRVTWLLVADASQAWVFESAGARKVAALDDMTRGVDLPKSRDLLAVKRHPAFLAIYAAHYRKP
jgi:hypothetical protein